MPRVRMNFDDSPRPVAGELVDKLVDELKSDRQAGQPFIYEYQFSTGKVRVLVVWDEWKDLSLEKRTAVILRAYDKAGEEGIRANIALASGVTVPEATAAGMLPYRVFPALRTTDDVTPQECREALLTEGATKLFGTDLVQLRLATQDQADECVKRLIARLPKSADVWLVTKELAIPDFDRAEELSVE